MTAVDRESVTAESRRSFIGQLAGGVSVLGALTACDSGTPISLVIPPSSKRISLPLEDNPRTQDILSRNGIFGVRENGIAVLRSDLKDDAALVKHMSRPYTVPCRFNCGGLTGYGGGDGFTVEYDGIPIGMVGNGFFEDGTALDFALYSADSNFFWDISTAFAYDGNYNYGPVYTIPRPIACAEQIITNVKNLAIVLVGAAINTLLSKYGPGTVAVVRSARGLIAGVVSLEGFCDVLISAISFVAVSELLADFAVGLTIGMILDYFGCLVWG